ncbi:MAG TPA: hypothetical protein VF733_04930 [Candidatus Saccharimonadales bacterium]
MRNVKRFVRRGLLVVGLVLGILASGVPAAAQKITQGYQAEGPLQKGMIVRLDPKDGSKVQAVQQNDGGDVLGVVVSSAEAGVSLSNTGVAEEIFVANSGQFDVLVSTQNGPINTGDYIALSSLAGVGMKADTKQQYVLGKALDSFDGKSTTEGTTTLKTSNGSQQVSLGRIGIEISVAHNPKYSKQAIAGVPNALAKLVQLATDRPVTAFRVYLGAGTALLSIIVAGVILFAGVRTSMTAVGRNPLAKKTIFRSLLQVVLIALIVFVIGGIAVYLLLRV